MKERLVTVGAGDKSHILAEKGTHCGLKKNMQVLVHQSKPMCRNCLKVTAAKRRMMAKPTHADMNSNCRQCHFKKGLGNRVYKGVKIPDGHGKCVRHGGLCEAKKASLASNQLEIKA